MRLLRAILFDARVHDKWSYEQLPMVQRIMNTVEKTDSCRTYSQQFDSPVGSNPSTTGFEHPW